MGIALDVAAGKIYWTSLGNDSIRRANLDGSGVEDLVINLSAPAGIVLTSEIPVTRVTICHKGMQTLTVSTNALSAHIRHGDMFGVCLGSNMTMPSMTVTPYKNSVYNDGSPRSQWP